MKTTFLKTIVFGTLLTAGLTLSSCGKNNNQSEGDADGNDAMETTTETDNTDLVMDTVVEDNDTIVRTGGGPNENPTGTQVP